MPQPRDKALAEALEHGQTEPDQILIETIEIVVEGEAESLYLTNCGTEGGTLQEVKGSEKPVAFTGILEDGKEVVFMNAPFETNLVGSVSTENVGQANIVFSLPVSVLDKAIQVGSMEKRVVDVIHRSYLVSDNSAPKWSVKMRATNIVSNLGSTTIRLKLSIHDMARDFPYKRYSLQDYPSIRGR